MFERFTETARRTLFFARHEATEVGGAAIEAEHILLALLRADKGTTPHLFAVANLSYTDALGKIRAHWGQREHVATSVELPFGDQAQRVVQHAMEEADRLGRKYVDNEQLLLGVLHEDSLFAAGLLRSHGMTIEGLRDQIVKSLVIPEPEPAIPPEGGGLWVKHEAFDPVASVERIRFLAEELGRSGTHVQNARGLMDDIHRHLDALKRYFA